MSGKYLTIPTCAILLVLHACMLNVNHTDSELIRVLRKYSDIKEREVGEEISQVKESLKNRQDNGSLYLSLAVLYSHANNPAPDYSIALHYMEEYIKENPSQAESGDIKTFALLLRKYVKLQAENKEWKEKIENIEKLNIQMEKLKKENK